MDIKKAIKGQYRGVLVMTRQCLTDCTDELWISGKHPRNFWRIAYHALFYTHLYAMPTEHDFMPWEKHRPVTDLWENPPVEEPFTKEELLSYLDFIDQNIEGWVDALDLESKESGFSWYPNLEKLDHQIVNIRHLATHMGQLSEIVMADGVSEIDWCTRVPR